MKIELGKRYVRRNGTVTGPIELSYFPFQDEDGTMYGRDGELSDGGSTEYDLVEEYTEPQQFETWGVIDTKELYTVATFGTLHHASLFATEMNKRGSYKVVKLCGELK